MRRPLFVVTWLALASALVNAAACKKNADPSRVTAMSCERVYHVCPNIVPASPSEATQCAESFQSRCGAELRQHIQCAMNKCDDAGAIDRVEIERACFSTIEAYRDCEDNDGGVGGPDGRTTTAVRGGRGGRDGRVLIRPRRALHARAERRAAEVMA